jgi:hypothetical protein
MPRPSVLCWFAFLPLVACKGGDASDDTDVSGDTDSSADTDASSDTDGTGDTDASEDTDTNEADTDVPEACTVSAGDFGDATWSNLDAYTMPPGRVGNPGDLFEVDGYLELADPGDLLSVAFYDGRGVFANGVVAPGTYTIAGDETNLFTCGVCVFLTTDVGLSSYGDEYMATSGTVTITQVDHANSHALEFAVSDVTLVHVTYDDATSTTTRDPDGCTTHVGSLSFSGEARSVP